MDASSPSDKPTVAEAYLGALYKHGIRMVFANGGTDSRERGTTVPRPSSPRRSLRTPPVP